MVEDAFAIVQRSFDRRKRIAENQHFPEPSFLMVIAKDRNDIIHWHPERYAFSRGERGVAF